MLVCYCQSFICYIFCYKNKTKILKITVVLVAFGGTNNSTGVMNVDMCYISHDYLLVGYNTNSVYC